jgi:hypothetical protein
MLNGCVNVVGERRIRNPEVLGATPGRSLRPRSAKSFIPSGSIN